MNLHAYLDRLRLEPDHLEPNEEVLRVLQRRHLQIVPFENLDIHWDRPIVLDLDRFYTKIVVERRGGFCYELNGLFNELLTTLGFKTHLISARVFNGSGHGPEYDHAAIIVTIGDDTYLADVGFGDFTTEPLRFSLGSEQQDLAGIFVIRRFEDDYFDVSKRADGDTWKSQYIFRPVPRELSDFSEMCDFQQFSPDSHFRKGKVCSILTESGRKTLTNEKFIVTVDGERIEQDVASVTEFDDMLLREFGISRPADA